MSESAMNAHPNDLIPAFVLGALAHDQMIEVGAHLSTCDACRAEAAAFRMALDEPPARVKRRLFARIASGSLRRPARWPIGLAGCLVALVLGLGYLLADARGQLLGLTEQLAQSQLASERLRTELELNEQAASFMSDPQTLARRLDSPGRHASVVMYMQAGNRHAVLIIRGMPKIEPGRIYQFWLARPGLQVPANSFEVDQSGAATLSIEAPAPLDSYDQAMVTIEQRGGAAQPSEQVVVSGALANAPGLLGGLAATPRLAGWFAFFSSGSEKWIILFSLYDFGVVPQVDFIGCSAV